MLQPKIGRKEILYEDKYQQIYSVRANFGDFTKDYFVRDSGKRAGLVVTNNDSVLLVRQHRLLINGLSWEIPGGKIEDGESPGSAAVRECQEETGVLCRNLKPPLNFQVGLDTTDNPTHLFYTAEFSETREIRPNPHEVVQHAWTPISQCIEMIFEQKIQDSLSIIAILSYAQVTSSSAN